MGPRQSVYDQRCALWRPSTDLVLSVLANVASAAVWATGILTPGFLSLRAFKRRGGSLTNGPIINRGWLWRILKRWRRLIRRCGFDVFFALCSQHKPRIRHGEQRKLGFDVLESLAKSKAFLGVAPIPFSPFRHAYVPRVKRRILRIRRPKRLCSPCRASTVQGEARVWRSAPGHTPPPHFKAMSPSAGSVMPARRRHAPPWPVEEIGYN